MKRRRQVLPSLYMFVLMRGEPQRAVVFHNVFKMTPTVTIILEDIQCQVNFLLRLWSSGAQSVGVTQLTLKWRDAGIWVLAWVWFDDDISVGRFTIYVCGDAAIWKVCQMYIQQFYGLVNFLQRELDRWVDRVRAIIESRSRVGSLSTAAEP
jgi:hypothetical protein